LFNNAALWRYYCFTGIPYKLKSEVLICSRDLMEYIE
jgi:hypothetical protein